MRELKLMQIVTEEALTIDLPNEWKGKSVEITIKEIANTPELQRKKLQEILLAGPTWTEEQYKAYLEANQHFSSWESQ